MAGSLMEIVSFDNPVFRAYLFYSSILALKILAMALLVARQRYNKKVFMNPEDTKTLKGSKWGVEDPDVERPRRAHLNDLENILVYFVASFVYMLTNPVPGFAIMLMRVYTLARIAHTIVYAVVVIPQPARGLSFFVGYFITIYMTIRSIIAFA